MGKRRQDVASHFIRPRRMVQAGFFLGLTALLSTVHADSPWVTTATKALGPKLVSAVPQGPANAATPLHVVVGLNLRNKAQLSNYIQHITTPGDPLFGTYLTSAAFMASYAPTAAQAQSVQAYLQSAGFTHVQIEPNNLLVTADGTVATAQAAFNTQIAQYQQFGETVYANTQDAQVPAALGGTVSAVLGLSNVNKLQPALHQGSRSSTSFPGGVPNTPTSLSPQDFWKAYNVGNVPKADGTTIAIITEGDMGPILSDLKKFEATYGLATVPVTVVQPHGSSTDTAGQTEFDMDTQTSTGIAGNVKQLILYDMPSSYTTEMTTAMNRFAADNIAKAMSASLGFCEALAIPNGDMAIDDQVMMQAVAQGQTLFFSSGDTGPTCPAPAVGGISNGVPDSGPVPGQEYPASSPYAIAVGGTTLFVNNDGSYNSEIAWNAGGGGFSTVEQAAAWQAPVLYPLLPTQQLPAVLPRGVPDIAMDADFLLSAAKFFDNGAATSNGGTSLAAPLSLGSWARIQNAHNNNLGFAGPLLYLLASPPSAANANLPSVTGFNDIVLGTNGGFVATPGYDLTTGLGSLDISAVNAAISEVLKTAGPGGIGNGVSATGLPTTGGDLCTAPGYLVSFGSAGTGVLQQIPDHVLAAYAAEIFTQGAADKFTISLDLDALPPAGSPTAYFVHFTLPDGLDHFVGYEATGWPSTPASPNGAFFYGHQTVVNPGAAVPDPTGGLIGGVLAVGTTTLYLQDGPADADSYLDVAHNRIVWVLTKSKIQGLAQSRILQNLYGEVVAEAGPGGVDGATINQLNRTAPADYTQRGNLFCAVPPTAGLLQTIPDPTAPLTVLLDGSSSKTAYTGDKVQTYVFDFGDGSQPQAMSTATVTHTYAQAGNYTASLLVTDSNGKTSPVQATRSFTLTAPTTTGGPAITAALRVIVPPDTSIPMTVTFDASATVDSVGKTLSYTFVYGDGNQSSPVPGAQLSYTYTTAGTFHPYVIVTDEKNNSAVSPVQTVTSTLSVTVLPGTGTIAELFADGPTVGPAPLTVTLDGSKSIAQNNTTIVSYSFNFGDGSPVQSGTATRATHVYTVPGAYQPTLTVIDSANHSSMVKAAVQVLPTSETPQPVSTRKGGGALGPLLLVPMLLGAGLSRRRKRARA